MSISNLWKWIPVRVRQTFSEPNIYGSLYITKVRFPYLWRFFFTRDTIGKLLSGIHDLEFEAAIADDNVMVGYHFKSAFFQGYLVATTPFRKRNKILEAYKPAEHLLKLGVYLELKMWRWKTKGYK